MKNLNFIKIILGLFLFAGTFTGCLEEELAFDVVESPVLAVFEDMDSGDINRIAVKATFYELDKSGILDQNVGIDSTRLSSLPIEVYINESQLLESFTTDTNGEIIFETELSTIGAASKLEWVGTFNQVDFRIYKNL
ncbi:MAG: hypothetical protein AAF694_23615 [Bacteroidota bacterium]